MRMLALQALLSVIDIGYLRRHKLKLHAPDLPMRLSHELHCPQQPRHSASEATKQDQAAGNMF
jgi:hypothetical protein